MFITVIKLIIFFQFLTEFNALAVSVDVNLSCGSEEKGFLEEVTSHLENKYQINQDVSLPNDEDSRKCPKSLHGSNVDDLINKIIKHTPDREKYRREWDHKCRTQKEFCIRLAEAIDWKESTFSFPIKDSDGVYKHKAFHNEMFRPGDVLRDLRSQIERYTDFNVFAHSGNGFKVQEISQLQLSFYFNNLGEVSKSRDGKVGVFAYGTWLYHLPSFAPLSTQEISTKLTQIKDESFNPLSCPRDTILNQDAATKVRVLAAKRCEAVMRRCSQFRIGTDYYDTRTGMKLNDANFSYTPSSEIAKLYKEEELGLSAFALKKENGQSYIYKKKSGRWTEHKLDKSLLTSDQLRSYEVAEKNLKNKFNDNPKLLAEFLPHVMAAHINNHPYFVYGTGIYLKDGTPADPRAIYPVSDPNYDYNKNIHTVAAYLNKQQSFLNLFDNLIYSFNDTLNKPNETVQTSALLESGFFISDMNEFYKEHLGIDPGSSDLIQGKEQMEKIANGILTGENFYRLENGDVYMIKDDENKFVNKKLNSKELEEKVIQYYGRKKLTSFSNMPIFADTGFKQELFYAMSNHKNVLEYNGKIYKLNCIYLGNNCNWDKDFETPILKANYPDLFLQRSLPSKNPVYLEKYWESVFTGSPYFVHDKKIYDANTGHPVNTRQAQEINLKMNSKKRERYKKLSQKDVVINHVMTSATCESGRFAVIDKKKGVVEYYSALTNEIFKSHPLSSSHKNRSEDKNSLCPAGVFKLNANLKHWEPKQNSNSCLSEIKTYDLGAQCKVVVVPSNDKVEFKLKNNDLALYVDDVWANDSWYFNPGVKNLVVTGDIFYKTDPKHPNSSSAQAFKKTLIKDKQTFLRNYNISSEDYDDLMMILFGILYQESKGGTDFNLKVKEGNQDLVTFLKQMDGNKSVNSRGLAQVKPTNLSVLKGPHLQEFQAYLRNFNEASQEKMASEWLTRPENNATTAMAILIESLQSLSQSAKEELRANAFEQATLPELTTYLFNNPYQMRSGKATPDESTYLNNVISAIDDYSFYAVNTKGHINTTHLSEMGNSQSQNSISAPKADSTQVSKNASVPAKNSKPNPPASGKKELEAKLIKENGKNYCRIFCRGIQIKSYPGYCTDSVKDCENCFNAHKEDEKKHCK